MKYIQHEETCPKDLLTNRTSKENREWLVSYYMPLLKKLAYKNRISSRHYFREEVLNELIAELLVRYDYFKGDNLEYFGKYVCRSVISISKRFKVLGISPLYNLSCSIRFFIVYKAVKRLPYDKRKDYDAISRLASEIAGYVITPNYVRMMIEFHGKDTIDIDSKDCCFSKSIMYDNTRDIEHKLYLSDIVKKIPWEKLSDRHRTLLWSKYIDGVPDSDVMNLVGVYGDNYHKMRYKAVERLKKLMVCKGDDMDVL